MGAKLDTIEADALMLSEEDRVELAERLLASLSDDDGVAKAWSDEVKRRVAAIESGAMRYVPISEALARAKKAIE